MTATTILLVDDEKTVLDSLKQQLRRIYGTRFGLETAESVTEAWEVIEELHEGGDVILVIVSDWLMPEIRGDDFLRSVHRRHPHIARIMLTGHADAEAVRGALDDAAVQKVLYKPWRIEELQAAIEGIHA